MKKLWFFVACFTLFSCTKVINIDVKESDIKYVVEGIITNEPNACRVQISRSTQLNNSNQFEQVSGAVVTVTDNGEDFLLGETSDGIYSTTLVNGTPGHLYTLHIAVDGEQFTSTSVMPQPVSMDSLYVSRGPFGQFKFATIRFDDPLAVDNGYRFVQYVNGVKEPTIFWEDDEFTDGQRTVMQLDASADEKDDPRNIKTGDEVTVEMHTLDPEAFLFWYSMRAGGGGGDGITAAPSNPVSNITGGALGYFSAHTVDRQKVIAQ